MACLTKSYQARRKPSRLPLLLARTDQAVSGRSKEDESHAAPSSSGRPANRYGLRPHMVTTLCVSVPLWLFFSRNIEPQRHRDTECDSIVDSCPDLNTTSERYSTKSTAWNTYWDRAEWAPFTSQPTSVQSVTLR